jgi:hypothetical protein
MPVTKGPRPKPRPRLKPKKPATPAARKGGRKKENVGAGRSAYGTGGQYNEQQKAQGTLKQEKVGQRRPSDRIPKMQTVTLKPTPQESKVRKRPGMARGGKARMKYADGGMPKAKPC